MPFEPSLLRRRAPLPARLAASLLLLLCGAVACGTAPAERITATRAAIAGGTADRSHASVFLLGWHEGRDGALCTATLIAPNLLLTARHCVAPSAGEGEDSVLCGEAGLGEPYPASAFFATNDPQPREGSPFFRAAQVRVPHGGEDTCGFDIALLILEQSVPSDVSTPAVPRIDREALRGEPYTAVGYGVNASGQTNGNRMQLGGLSVSCPPGSCGEGVESTEFVGETGICSGDSGGPAFDADGKVLGVVSRGGPDCSVPVYGSVGAWRDFIVQTASDAAELGGYAPPFWVTSGSSDAPTSPGDGGAGGDGGAPTGAGSGERCASASECRSGLVCYAEASASVGRCTASCSSAADCDDGLVCTPAGSASVCLEPSGSGDDPGGCSVARARAPGSWAALWALGGGVLAAARRRRRS